MIEAGQQVILKRDVSRTPLTVRKIVRESLEAFPQYGRLLAVSRGEGDLGATFWEDEVDEVTE